MDAFEQGVGFEQSGKYGEAITAFEEAIRADPQHVGAWVHLGTMLQFTNGFPESISAFEKAIALNPADAYAWQGKARSIIELKANREREALDAANHALAINPNLADAHYDKGRALAVLVGENDMQSAMAEFREAIRLQPTHVLAMQDLALALAVVLSRFDEAIGWASRAVQINPNLPKAWLALAWGYFGTSSYYKALESVERAVQMEPDNGMAWFLKGGILRELVKPERNVARLDQAIAAFDRALALDPTEEMFMEAKKEAIRTRDQIHRTEVANGIRRFIGGFFS